MDPLFSAFAPSLAGSLAGGASGAMQGELEGEDRLLNNQLKQAQIDWQKAHAAGYQHGQKTSMMAMQQLQEGIAKDPNFLHSDVGRFLAFTAGKFDPNVQDASADRYAGQANASNAHALLFGNQSQTDAATRQPKVDALTGLGNQRQASADQTTQLTPGKVELLRENAGLSRARQRSEASLATMRDYQGILAKERAALAKAHTTNAAKGGSINLHSLALMLNDRINAALQAGEDPEPNDIILYDDVRNKLHQGDFGAVPLGSPGTFDRSTGQMVQPEVPPTTGMFGYGGKPGVPATPPSKQPLNLTPRPKPGAMRPGAAQQDQDMLKAQKLIKERGIKFAGDQLKSNKALTPTEKLALQQALEKAMTGASLNE